MAVKTTKQQFNQDCTFLGKVDFDQDVVLGKNGEVDGDLKVNGKITDGEGNEKYITTDTMQTIRPDKPIGKYFQGNGNNDVHLIYGPHDYNVPHIGVKQASIYADLYARGFIFESGWIFFPRKVGTFALTSDIPAIYRHMVTITIGKEKGKEKGIISINPYLKENQVIDSIQDLCTFCGNTDFQVTGVYPMAATPIYLHVGTSISDTLIYGCNDDNEVVAYSVATEGVLSVSDSVTTLVAPIATSKENLFPEEEEEDEPEAKKE